MSELDDLDFIAAVPARGTPDKRGFGGIRRWSQTSAASRDKARLARLLHPPAGKRVPGLAKLNLPD